MRNVEMVPKLWLISLMVIMVKKEITADGLLYVNQLIGSSRGFCGSIKTPCKYLQHAVNNCAEGGKVIVQGKQTVTTSIEMTKDISIVGNDEASITGSTFHEAVFHFSRTGGTFHLVDIRFIDTAIVSIQKRSNVTITNCTVRHTPIREGRLLNKTVIYGPGEIRDPRGPIIQLDPEAKGTNLEVIKSTFIGSQQRYILKMVFRSSLQTSSTFDSCIFEDSLGLYLSEVENALLVVKNCTFYNITCTAIHMNTGLGGGVSFLFVEKSFFIQNKGCTSLSDMGRWSLDDPDPYGRDLDSGGAIYVRSISSVNVSDCEFRNCRTGWLIKKCLNKACLSQHNVGNGGAIFVHNSLSVVIKRSNFHRNIAYNFGGDISMEYITNIFLENCTFSNSKSTNGGSIYSFRTDSVFHNCLFTENISAGKGGAVSFETAEQRIFAEQRITFKDCMFRRNKAIENGGAIAMTTKEVLHVNIESCRFIMNSGDLGGAVMISTMFSLPTTRLAIYNCLFNGNAALIGGGIYALREIILSRPPTDSGRRIPLYLLFICHCSFRNNIASSLGQSIYSNVGIQVEDTVVFAVEKYVAPHLSVETGDISLSNIRVQLHRNQQYNLGSSTKGIVLKSDDIKLSRGFTFTCPTNFNVHDMKNTSVVVTTPNMVRTAQSPRETKTTSYKIFSVDCLACPYGYYILKAGRLYISEFSPKVPPENKVTIQHTNCVQCPTGAVCDVDVKAVNNFWGYAFESKLLLKICPLGYCCGSDTTPCSSYNICARGRTGLLCGSCAEGYRQDVVKDGCVPRGQRCNLQLFTAFVILYTLVYSLIFIVITNAKDIIVLLKRLISIKEPVIDSDEVDGGNKLPIAGFVQINILFVQVAGLLQVNFEGTQQEDSYWLSERIQEACSFRFTALNLDLDVCPSDDLTLPQKEFILFGMNLMTFFHLLMLFIFQTAIKRLVHCLSSQRNRTTAVPSQESSIELTCLGEEYRQTPDLPEEVSRTLSFANMIKCTFIKLLKLYYSPIAKSALMMVHCVSIVNKSHLYVYGDHKCYSGWQIGIMVIILPNMLMFPICFQIALHLLKDRQLSSWQFVFVVACPYYAIFLYLWKRTKETNRTSNVSHSKDEDSFRLTILEGEELLFKEVKGCSLGWQVVQLYRALVITALNTFLTNPIYRQLSYIVLFLVFVIHDRNRKPYKHQYLNFLQSLSSRCLVIVLVCNIIPAVSYLVNVRTVPSIHKVVKVLKVIELIMHTALPLSLPIWKVKTVIDGRRKSRKTR